MCVLRRKFKAEIAYMVDASSSEGMWISAYDWEGVISVAAFFMESSFLLDLFSGFCCQSAKLNI